MTDPLIPVATLSDKFDSTRPALSPLAAHYMSAKDTYAHEKFQREQAEVKQQEGQVLSGQLSPDEVTRRVNVPASIIKAQEEKKKAERAYDQLVFDMLLDGMRERLAELDELLAERHEKLEGKYGHDVIGGIAETYLTEDELRGLKTDKDKMRALADKFLDKDGQIKGKYEHLEEAHYVRDWVEADKLRPVVEKYSGRDYLTAMERKEVLEAAKGATLSENTNRLAVSANREYQATVDQAVDDGRNLQSDLKSAQGFNFG